MHKRAAHFINKAKPLIKGTYSRAYKIRREKEKFDNTKFKMMNKKSKVRHIQALVSNFMEDSSSQRREDIRDRSRPRSTLQLRPTDEVRSEHAAKFRMARLNLDKLNQSIE